MTKPNKFIYNSTESQIAELLGVTTRTLANWRESGKIPKYLYRRFGDNNYSRIRYCELLVLRWQHTPESEKTQEELSAIEAIKDSLKL